jgi:hypothetical protein
MSLGWNGARRAQARARGRKGGRPYKMTVAQLRMAMAAMGQQETNVTELCRELADRRRRRACLS